MSNSIPHFSDALDDFRATQQLAYACATEVAAELDEGVTERQAAALLRTWLADHGVRDWLHQPFAWFGDRTAFTGFRVPVQFLPSGRRLTDGMAFILDVAPTIGAATADIGFTSSLGDNPIVDRILDDLADHRDLIATMVRERHTFAEIYRAVDALAARQGFANRHRKYPSRVLAHIVEPVDPDGRSRVKGVFGSRHLRGLVGGAARSRQTGWSPLWNGSSQSDHPPVPGLWAVEPHLGFRGTGAKFEELLVVTEDDAYWLDDDLPHVRRWTERGVEAGRAGSRPTASRPTGSGHVSAVTA